MRAPFLVLVVGLAIAGAVDAQQATPGDLTTLFDLGQLVLDTNGDSVPDFTAS